MIKLLKCILLLVIGLLVGSIAYGEGELNKIFYLGSTINTYLGATCVITGADKIVQCWGSNYYGQLGNGISYRNSEIEPGYKSNIPVTVKGIKNARKLINSCALLEDGDVKCWGVYDKPYIARNELPTLLTGMRNILDINNNTRISSQRYQQIIPR